MNYILEVQRFEWNGKSEHVGYMNKIFTTKQEASDYYDKFNPHMRSLHAHNSWCSDWDLNYYLMYIVRERYYEYLKIPSFEDAKK